MQEITRQHFNTLMQHYATLYGGYFNGRDNFSVNPVGPELEQRLERRIQERSTLLSKINVTGVRDLKGEKLGMYSASRVAGRTNTSDGNTERKTRDVTGLEGRLYELFKTDFDTHITYARLDNWSSHPEFQAMYRDCVLEQIANDRVTIGWYGEVAAPVTDLTAHPMLQDVNRGWFQALREDKPENLLGTAAQPIKLGPGGTYETLDMLVFDLKNVLIDPVYRNRTDLVLILGDELWTMFYGDLLNDNLKATEREAREAWVKRNTIAGLPVAQETFFPGRGLLVTSYKNLSIYYQRGSRRRIVIDNPRADRIEDFNSVNEGYVIEDYRAIAGVDFKHLLLPDGTNGWA
jgi:P2 family phage major capsid protein